MLEKPSLSAIDTTDDLQKFLVKVVAQANANEERLDGVDKRFKNLQRNQRKTITERIKKALGNKEAPKEE